MSRLRPLGLLGAVLLLGLLSPTPAAARSDTGACADGAPVLRVWPRRGDGYIHLAERYTGTRDSWRAIRSANGRRKVQVGRSVAVPYNLLTARHRHRTLISLFPEDAYAEGNWNHRVGQNGAAGCREDLKRLAAWFTGTKCSSLFGSAQGHPPLRRSR